MDTSASRLFEEIREQPACLSRLTENFPGNFAEIRLPGVFTQKLIGIAEGSSYNALKIAAPYVEEFTGLNNFTFDPESIENKFDISRYVDHPNRQLFERSYFLAVSQSGRTASLVNTVSHLQEILGFANHHAPLLSFTNNAEGTLAAQYGNHFDLSVGPEKSIAATKSMTASIMSLLLFGLYLGQRRSWLNRSVYQQFYDILAEIPEKLDRFLSDDNVHHRIEAFANALCDTNQFVILSKGMLASILPEVGLKLTETSSNIVWTDNTESFKHGRKVILKGVKGVRPNCVYLIPPDIDEVSARQIFQDIQSHFYVGEDQVFSTEGLFFTVFENSPPIPEALRRKLNMSTSEILTLPEAHGIESLFLGIVAFQLLSHYLAIAKGEDPNNPALDKAVTQ